MCLFLFKDGAQKDGEDEEEVHVTLISSTPRSKNKRSPKETPTSSKKVSDFFLWWNINLLVLSFMPSYLIFKQQLPTCSNDIISIIFNHFIYCLAAMWYHDQGICQLGVKLFAEESFLLGIDWSLTSRCNASNDQFVFFSLLCGTVIKVYVS